MTFKKWLLLITVGALGLLIFLAWQDIMHALGRLKDLNPWLLLGTVPMLILFYWSLAKFFESFFKAVGSPVDMKTLFNAMLELNFVNHVFPSSGLSGFSYLTLRLKMSGLSTARITLSQIARFGFAFIGQIVLMFLSLFLLAIEQRASSLIVLTVSLIVFSIVLTALVGLFIISNEARCVKYSRILATFINRLIRVVRRKQPETIKLSKVEKTFLELHEDYMLLRQDIRKMTPALAWISLSIVLEMSSLYLVFLAHGVWVNPGAIVIAFVIAGTAGLIVALPGGIGVFETLMTTVFIAVGIPPSIALSVTLVYRVIVLLLSLISGGILYQLAVNKFGNLPAAGFKAKIGRQSAPGGTHAAK